MKPLKLIAPAAALAVMAIAGSAPAQSVTKTFTREAVGISRSCSIQDGEAFNWGLAQNPQLFKGESRCDCTPTGEVRGTSQVYSCTLTVTFAPARSKQTGKAGRQ